MMFSSIPFLYYFLPAVLIVYFLSPRKIPLRNMILLVASTLFYAWGGPVYLILVFGLILLGWIWGLLINRWRESHPKRAKAALVLSIITGLSGLLYFKYTDFFLSNINRVPGLEVPLPGLIVPIGISFYTFQLLSYNIDLYRGDARVQKNVFTLATYVMLFPQLVAGPIVRYSDIEAALHERTHSLADVSGGLSRFCVGLAKKVLIGNTLGEMIHLLETSGEQSVLAMTMRAAGFGLQIYFDFSGYSDMAIGLGKVFGIRILENFNYPYTSRSITEFWRRWHISLGLWLRDYVYFPLGGARKRQWLNILIVWTMIGFLQGAAWNFIGWGLYFVVVLIIEKALLKKYLKLDSWPSVLRRVYTLVTILCSFFLFRSINIFAADSWAGDFSLYYLQSYAVILAVCAIGATQIPKRIFSSRFAKPLAPIAVALCLIVSTAFLVDGTFNPFLYFRF